MPTVITFTKLQNISYNKVERLFSNPVLVDIGHSQCFFVKKYLPVLTKYLSVLTLRKFPK